LGIKNEANLREICLVNDPEKKLFELIDENLKDFVVNPIYTDIGI